MKKLLESLKFVFITFFLVSIVLTWLQGGGRYRYNIDLNGLLYLYIAVPIALIVGGMVYVQEFKKK